MTRQGAVEERNSFGTAGTLRVGQETYAVHRLADIAPAGLPISLRIVLENLLRHEDGVRVTTGQVESLLAWGRTAPSYRRGPGSCTRSTSSTCPAW